jgi:hypothetical protein
MAGWFRYFFVASVIIGALLVSVGFSEIASQKTNEGHRATQIESMQTGLAHVSGAIAANRIDVIIVLCNAQNESRAEGIRLHAHDTGAKRYKLKLLSCSSLEQSARVAAEPPTHTHHGR